MIRLPIGFKPLKLADMLIHFGESQFTPMLVGHLGLTPEEIAEAVAVMESRGLIQFAIAPGDVPAVFTAAAEQFTFAAEKAFADKIVSFFDVTGNFDGTVRDALHPTRTGLICDFCSDPNPKHSEELPDFVLEGHMESIGGWATCETCHQLIKENRRKDLLNRAIDLLSFKSHILDKASLPALKLLHQKFWEKMEQSKRPPLPPTKVPHWQEALDRKFEAIKQLAKIHEAGVDKNLFWDLQEDMRALKVSDVYSFNAETMHAILTGSQSIPHESTLKSIELPAVKAGWFWFGEPMPCAASPVASDFTHALLWTWDTAIKTPTLRFSAYVVDEKGKLKGSILPSTKWFWPTTATFHEMLALNAKWYQEVYTPERKKFINPDHLVGKDATLKVISDMSLFFLMSCLWFKQTVPGQSKLTQGDGHIERHARKRYVREHKLDAMPTVKVIALRRSQATATEPSDGEKKHHLHVRFVVSGHARLQACGPERKDRKLIWIDSFVKGPGDAPFKESGPKVYAVVR